MMCSLCRAYVIRVKKKTTPSSTTKKEALQPMHYEDNPNDYIAAELLQQNATMKFVVGDAKTYAGYFNAPLDRGAEYDIRVGSVSKGNGTVRFCGFPQISPHLLFEPISQQCLFHALFCTCRRHP